MKINKNIFSNNWLWITVFLLFSFFYFKPFLFNPAFNLIDDGVSIKNAQEVLNGNFNSIVETNNGRIRPFYWLYFVFIYIFSGTNPLGYWIGQMIVVVLTLFIIWLIIKKNYKNKPYIHLFTGLFLNLIYFIPAVTENLYRLGTAEIRQVFIIFFFLLWIQKQTKKVTNILWGVILFCLSILTKETSLLLIPILWLYFIPYFIENFKKYKKIFCLSSSLTVFSILFYLFLSAMKEYSSYTSNFSISLAQIKNNLLISRLNMNEIFYILLLLIILTSIRFFAFLLKSSKKKHVNILTESLIFWKKNNLILTSLVAISSFLFFIFSWQYQLERYYYPVFIFLIFYLILEIVKSYQFFNKVKDIKIKTAFLLIPVILIIASYFTIFQKTLPEPDLYIQRNKLAKKRWFGGYQKSYSIIKKLLVIDKDAIFTSITDYEVIYELALYANNYNFNENKITMYANNNDLAERYPYIEHSSTPFEDFIKFESEEKIFITTSVTEYLIPVDEYEEIKIHNKYSNVDEKYEWIIWKVKND